MELGSRLEKSAGNASICVLFPLVDGAEPLLDECMKELHNGIDTDYHNALFSVVEEPFGQKDAKQLIVLAEVP